MLSPGGRKEEKRQTPKELGTHDVGHTDEFHTKIGKVFTFSRKTLTLLFFFIASHLRKHFSSSSVPVFVWRSIEMWIFPFFCRLRLPLSEKRSLVICFGAHCTQMEDGNAAGTSFKKIVLENVRPKSESNYQKGKLRTRSDVYRVERRVTSISTAACVRALFSRYDGCTNNSPNHKTRRGEQRKYCE